VYATWFFEGAPVSIFLLYASIDLGHHMYRGNLTNYPGKKARPEKHNVKIETHYWPADEYQLVNAWRFHPHLLLRW